MITDDFWEIMIKDMNKYDDQQIYEILEKNSIIYNVEVPYMIKYFIDYFIKRKTELLTEKILTLFTYIIHNLSTRKKFLVYFFLHEFRALNKL